MHQHHRDLQRSSKNDTFSDTQAFANTLKSGVLEERCVEMKRQLTTDLSEVSWMETDPVLRSVLESL